MIDMLRTGHQPFIAFPKGCLFLRGDLRNSFSHIQGTYHGHVFVAGSELVL